MDLIIKAANDDPAMIMKLLMSTQKPQLKFSAEETAWIKTKVLVHACKMFPCTNPMKNPILKPCLTGAANKRFTYANLFLDSACKDDGANLFGTYYTSIVVSYVSKVMLGIWNVK